MRILDISKCDAQADVFRSKSNGKSYKIKKVQISYEFSNSDVLGHVVVFPLVNSMENHTK